MISVIMFCMAILFMCVSVAIEIDILKAIVFLTGVLMIAALAVALLPHIVGFLAFMILFYGLFKLIFS